MRRPGPHRPAPRAERCRTCRFGSETQIRPRPQDAPSRFRLPTDRESGHSESDAAARTRPLADDDLRAGQIERQERRQVVFHRKAADADENRSVRSIAAARSGLKRSVSTPRVHIARCAKPRLPSSSINERVDTTSPPPPRESGAAARRSMTGEPAAAPKRTPESVSYSWS